MNQTTVSILKTAVTREDFGPAGADGDKFYADWLAFGEPRSKVREVLLQYAKDVGGIWDHEGAALDKAVAALERP